MINHDASAYQKAYRKAHRDQLRAYAQQYYVKNKARMTAAMKARHIANRESNLKRFRANWRKNKHKYALQRKQHYQLNTEKILTRTRFYHRNNPHVGRASGSKYEARKKGATLGDPKLIYEWMEKIRALRVVRCHWCGDKVRGVDVHFDHVLALSNGGAHSIDNLCASCEHCNCSKRDLRLRDWMAKGQKFFDL